MAKKKSGKSSAIGRKATGKHKRASGKHKRSTGRHGSVRTSKPSGHELVNVVCSECFSEFAFDTGVNTDTLECPICGHVSNRPDDGTLHKVSSLSKAEKTNFIITLFLTLVALGGFAGWAVVQRNPLNSYDDGAFWGPMGTAIAATFILLIFIPKYEKNRWETYF